MDTDPRIHQLAQSIFDAVRAALGPVWREAIGPADRELIRSCCLEAAGLEVRAMAMPRNNESRRLLLREKARINARLGDLAASTENTKVARAFWQAVRRAANRAVAIAVAVI